MAGELGDLHIMGVSKHYPTRDGLVPALEDVTLHVPHGEVGVLLGPSGCGKSTLLRMVAGLEAIDSGRITLSGRPVAGPGRDRGLVFQAYTSFPWLTVEENVAYGLKVNGSVRQQTEGVVAHFLEAVGLTRFRHHFPDQLSGGMRQRVAIARALANEPELLLMDEPFGALDPDTRDQMQELVLDIVHRERRTVLIVTHDIEEALYMGDRIAFLSSHPGRLQELIMPSRGARPAKAELKQTPEYGALHAHIRGLMREQGRRRQGAPA